MAEQNQQNKNEEKDLNQLLKVRREKLKDLQDNGKDPFQITKFDVTAHSSEIKDNFEQMDGKEVTIAGRMMSKRVMGKASFCNVQDLKGNIQSYVARDSVGEEAYKDFKKMDIGDIVGIKGTVFRTKMGEISVHAESIVLLSKSLQILPEKFHGLTNTLSSEICGSHHESGSKRHLCKTFSDPQGDPQFPGWTRIYGSGDPDVGS